MPVKIFGLLILSIINWAVSIPVMKYLIKSVTKNEISWGQAVILAAVIQVVNLIVMVLLSALQ